MNTEIDRKIAVIFVADVVGYSKHMENDENATIKSYSACEKILSKLLKNYKGSVFNTGGDSVLVEFPSAVNAVECGVAFQNEIKQRNASDKTDIKLEFRLGINMGDVVNKDGNLIGDGVNIAARLEALAQPNGITISKSVYDFVVPKTKMTFNDLGVQKVKQNEFHAFDILLDPSQKRILKKNRKFLLPSIGIIAVVAIVIMGFFSSYKVTLNDNQTAISRTVGDRLYVAKIKNISNQTEFDFLGFGIEQQLLGSLPRTSILPLVVGDEREAMISEKLSDEQVSQKDVRFVLKGFVQANKKNYRVNLEIIDLLKKDVIWSFGNDYLVEDSFKAQDELEFEVRKGIQQNLTMGKQFSDALIKYFGRGDLYKEVISNIASFQKGNSKIFFNHVEPFRKIKLETSENSMAHLLYAIALYNEMAINFDNYSENKKEILKSIRKANELDPSNHMVYPAMAFLEYVLSDETDNRTVIALKGLNKDPDNYFSLYWASHAFQYRQTVENVYPAEMLTTSDLLRKALSIAPFASESTRIFLFRSLVEEGKLEDAYTLVEEMLEKGNTRSTFWGTLCKAYLKYSVENDFEGAKTGLNEYIEQANLNVEEMLAEFDQYPYRHYDPTFFGLQFFPKIADLLGYELNASYGLIKKESE
ncbi:hypothetical protein OA343_00105 [Paracoccaceae bacterium]|nr:hypothetical protein [Paracoccaceae bacterium]